jgi:hypothetical protein
MPSAAVKLPSLPPPTLTPSTGPMPTSIAAFCAAANSSLLASVGIGGRLTPPDTEIVARASTGAKATISLSTRRASASDVTRTSTRISALAGTTFSAVPALATVGVTVVPRSGRAMAVIAST